MNIIFVDGAAINNGKKNCEAGIGVYCEIWQDNEEYEAFNIIENITKKFYHISNQVAELYACLLGIETYENMFGLLKFKKNDIKAFITNKTDKESKEESKDSVKKSVTLKKITGCKTKILDKFSDKKFKISKNIEYINQDNKNILYIITDSEYMINCITVWCSGWIMKGWKLSTGKNVKNRQFIEKIYDYYTKYNIKFVHVNSHCYPPKDTDSVEYKLWYGNYVADGNASLSLKQ